MIELNNVWKPGTDLLREQLYHAGNTAGRFAVLIGYLRTCRDQMGKELSGCVAWALANFRKTAGRGRIADICSDFGVSRKHLTQQFREEVGLTPKRFARIVKFSAIIETLGGMERVNWSDFALACGYYDQAHFSKEFKAFTGGTATEYLRVRSPDGKSALYE